MSGRRPRNLAIESVALLLVLLMGGRGRLAGQMFPAEARPDSALENAIRLAFAEATRRLASDPCLRVLSEFRDRSGIALSRRLEESGESLSSYLRTLSVSTGDNRELCRSAGVLAGTRPGGRNVYFCSRRFVRVQFHDPRLAGAVVIHEVLHTLGLPENPPPSEEITARVLARCGDTAAKNAAGAVPK